MHFHLIHRMANQMAQEAPNMPGASTGIDPDADTGGGTGGRRIVDDCGPSAAER